MFCLYSKGCEYAIRALAEISIKKAKGRFLARDICRKAGIPESYARKTFQALAQNGFLRAVPGPGGGYSLMRDPGKMTVLDIVEAVEGKKGFSKCILGLSSCGDRKPCGLHSVWIKLKAQIMEELDTCTLYRLAASPRIGRNKLRNLL